MRESGGGEGALLITIKRREQFRNARIFLPQVLHKHGRKYRPLSYESDILAALDWDKITKTRTNIMPGAVDDEMREITARVDLPGGKGGHRKQQEIETDKTLSMSFLCVVWRMSPPMRGWRKNLPHRCWLRCVTG